jgi:hypothetical protein
MLTTGLRVGLQAGLRVGINPTDGPVDPLASVAQDATSGIYCPANAAQWSALLGVAGIASGAPASAWLCQEASGNLADSIGAAPLAAVGLSHLYQQTVTGWSRKAMGLNNLNHRFERAGFANTATTSVLLLAYVQNLSTPAASSGIAGMGTSTTQYGAVLIAGSTTVRARSTNLQDSAANAFGTNTVRPVAMLVDVTGSRTRFYTDAFKLSPAYAACAGQLLTLGAPGGGTAISGRYLYAAAFTGAAAELSDAQVKTLLQTLGWTIPWS